jgi:ferredoxin
MPEQEPAHSFQIILETPEGERHLVCGKDEYLWDAAARQGVELPSICLQGRCLTCAGKLVEGTVDQSSADSIFREDEEAGFVLLCRTQPRSNVRVRTHQALQMREHRLAHGLPAPYA